MSVPFFVTGLPRSRTAWLANWLTTDHSICWHDVRFERNMVASQFGIKTVGFSSSELVSQFEEIKELFPEAPWIVVLRNSQDALVAFKRWAGDLLPQDDLMEKFWADRCHEIGKLCTHGNVTTVKYEDLDLEPICAGIWSTLLPHIAFDAERWKLLNGLKVEQHIEKNLNRFPSLCR